MQESYSGTFMTILMMIFFLIFVTFIGVALNFAKIYRIKNGVINILEQYQYNGNILYSSTVEANLKTYLLKVPYGYAEGIQSESFFNNYCANRVSDNESVDRNLFTNYGVCAIKKKVNNKYFYTVTVYYMIEFPIFNLDIPISASGETIAIDDYEEEENNEEVVVEEEPVDEGPIPTKINVFKVGAEQEDANILNHRQLVLKFGEKTQLTYSFSPEPSNNFDKRVTWSSNVNSSPCIDVDNNGNIKSIRDNCSGIITVTSNSNPNLRTDISVFVRKLNIDIDDSLLLYKACSIVKLFPKGNTVEDRRYLNEFSSEIRHRGDNNTIYLTLCNDLDKCRNSISLTNNYDSYYNYRYLDVYSSSSRNIGGEDIKYTLSSSILAGHYCKSGRCRDFRIPVKDCGAHFVSNNPDIVTVDSSGTVTAKKAGLATVTVYPLPIDDSISARKITLNFAVNDTYFKR